MPQEPWKRAYQLQRAVPRDVRRPVPPPPTKRPSGWGPIVGVLVALILLAGGSWWCFDREGFRLMLGKDNVMLGWFGPRHGMRASSPAVPPSAGSGGAAPSTQPPVVKVDQLDQGLGIALVIFGNYADVVSATKPWGVTWKTAAAARTIRLSAPGLTVYAEKEQITGWRLDLDAVQTADCWAKWQPGLRAAGLLPIPTTQTAGEHSEYLTGTGGPQSPPNQHPVYELRYRGGRLKEIRAGVSVEGSSSSITDAPLRSQPPTESYPAQPGG